MSRRDAAKRALENVRSLHRDFHPPILNALEAEGLIEPSNGGVVLASRSSDRLERLHAAANDSLGGRPITPRNATLELRRIGVPFSEEDGASVDKLTAAIARWNPTERIRIKSQLHRVGLLD